MKAEEQAVKDRFEKAESALSRKVPVKDTHLADNSGRVIRDSFTMPSTDYDLIAALKKRCIKAGVSVNKSQLLRAGLNALNAMSDRELAEMIGSLVEVKPGRRATQ